MADILERSGANRAATAAGNQRIPRQPGRGLHPAPPVAGGAHSRPWPAATARPPLYLRAAAAPAAGDDQRGISRGRRRCRARRRRRFAIGVASTGT